MTPTVESENLPLDLLLTSVLDPDPPDTYHLHGSRSPSEIGLDLDQMIRIQIHPAVIMRTKNLRKIVLLSFLVIFLYGFFHTASHITLTRHHIIDAMAKNRRSMQFWEFFKNNSLWGGTNSRHLTHNSSAAAIFNNERLCLNAISAGSGEPPEFLQKHRSLLSLSPISPLPPLSLLSPLSPLSRLPSIISPLYPPPPLNTMIFGDEG